jgi:WD40 repeat protein
MFFQIEHKWKKKIGGGSGYVRKSVTDSNHHGYLLKCVLSPDCSKLVTCSSDKTAKIWSMADHPRRVQVEKTLAQHQRLIVRGGGRCDCRI